MAWAVGTGSAAGATGGAAFLFPYVQAPLPGATVDDQCSKDGAVWGLQLRRGGPGPGWAPGGVLSRQALA
jgi:hypothetical protein